jgi:UDP-2,3-diacylglucosamine pyrophosphatase LpxH
LEIDDNRPIGIAFTGDQHIGGLYTDHEGMLRDYERLSKTDGLYTVLMGDLTDNYITRSHAGGSFEQSMTADKQRDIAEYILKKYFTENCIALIKGNHDNWTTKETGEDFIRYLAREIETPYLWYGGEINVRLGNAVYRIHAHHTFKYNSSLNTTNSQRNLFAATHADIIALGHLHYNETHAKTAGGQDTVWMRTGSYKITDDYGQYLAGLKADPRIPMVILFPDKKKILPFRDYNDGIAHLAMLRK